MGTDLLRLYHRTVRAHALQFCYSKFQAHTYSFANVTNNI